MIISRPHTDAADTSTPPRILVKGVGLVSPLGRSAWGTFKALLAGGCLTDRLARLEQRQRVQPHALARWVGTAQPAVPSPWVDPVVALAEHAARQAISEAAAAAPSTMGAGGGIDAAYLGISKGAMSTWGRAAERFHQWGDSGARGEMVEEEGEANDDPAELARVVMLGPGGYAAAALQQRLELSRIETRIAACASSLVALDTARRRMLQPGGPRRVLVLTAEAALLPMFIASYQRLGVLPPLTVAGYRGRPLDGARGGFVLAELAAAVVLERVEPGQPVEPGSLALTGTATGCEPYDLIRPAPAMPVLRELAAGLIGDAPLDLLHPHATGTAGQDEVELSVYAEVLAQPAAVYACKGALGHGLGAAGLVSLVLACLCARAEWRPPMPWVEHPIVAEGRRCRLEPMRDAGRGRFQRQAVFAAGFGGHTAGAVVEQMHA